MEPLRPSTRQSILEERPQAAPADIEEYERLLTERYNEDPDDPAVAVPQPSPFAAPYGASKESLHPWPQEDAAREKRLTELHEKLFGGTQAPQSEAQRELSY